MERISSHLRGYTLLEHKVTGSLYVVSQNKWMKFLTDMRNRIDKSEKLDLNVIKINKNSLGEYDITDEVETINYKYLHGVLIGYYPSPISSC